MSAAKKWLGFPLLAYDTETTGIDVYNDRIVTASLIELRPGHRPAITSYVVDPGIDIPDEASAVHGYTRDRAIAEQTHTPAQALYEITGRLSLWMRSGLPIVGMNLAYDLTLTEAENHRHDIDTMTSRLGVGKIQPVLDVLVLDKHLDPYRKGGRRLEQLCAHYGVRHTGAHDAGGDALASARIFHAMVNANPRVFNESLTLGRLHQQQARWRRDQQNSLREYFDRKGTKHDGVCGSWPLHGSCCMPRVGVA